MRTIQDHLIAGISMHGGHDAALDRISVIQSLRHRSQAVGGAGSGADDLIVSGQGVLVYAVHDGLQIVASGSGDNNLLGAGIDVSHCLVLLGVEAGALQHDINAQFAPGAIVRVFFGIDGDLLAVNRDAVLVGLDGMAHTDIVALSGVILQQVGQHSGAGQIVNCDDLVTFSTEHLTESQTADTAKTIDCNFYCHKMEPPKIIDGYNG